LSPTEIKIKFPPNFEKVHMNMNAEKLKIFKNEIEEDQRQLLRYIENAQLEIFYTQIIATISKESNDAEEGMHID
jgi:hypothetical protein